MAERINNYKALRVYQNALDAAMKVFELSKSFPKEEKYSLVDQMRRSSRSVCSNIAEAWRKRRYEGAFVSKLSDAETEACETQVRPFSSSPIRSFRIPPIGSLFAKRPPPNLRVKLAR